MQPEILFVDDDVDFLESIQDSLWGVPYQIHVCDCPLKAFRVLDQHPIAVLVSDERMPGLEGSNLVSLARCTFPNTVRIMLTGQASLESAARAVNQGAVFRLLLKPCPTELLLESIRMAAKTWVQATSNSPESLAHRLEREHPGITSVHRDERGRISLGRDDAPHEGKVSHEQK